MERVFLLTKGCGEGRGRLGGKKNVKDPEVVAGILCVLFLWTLQLMYLPNSQIAFSFS